MDHLPSNFVLCESRAEWALFAESVIERTISALLDEQTVSSISATALAEKWFCELAEIAVLPAPSKAPEIGSHPARGSTTAVYEEFRFRRELLLRCHTSCGPRVMRTPALHLSRTIAMINTDNSLQQLPTCLDCCDYPASSGESPFRFPFGGAASARSPLSPHFSNDSALTAVGLPGIFHRTSASASTVPLPRQDQLHSLPCLSSQRNIIDQPPVSSPSNRRSSPNKSTAEGVISAESRGDSLFWEGNYEDPQSFHTFCHLDSNRGVATSASRLRSAGVTLPQHGNNSLPPPVVTLSFSSSFRSFLMDNGPAIIGSPSGTRDVSTLSAPSLDHRHWSDLFDFLSVVLCSSDSMLRYKSPHLQSLQVSCGLLNRLFSSKMLKSPSSVPCPYFNVDAVEDELHLLDGCFQSSIPTLYLFLLPIAAKRPAKAVEPANTKRRRSFAEHGDSAILNESILSDDHDRVSSSVSTPTSGTSISFPETRTSSALQFRCPSVAPLDDDALAMWKSWVSHEDTSAVGEMEGLKGSCLYSESQRIDNATGGTGSPRISVSGNQRQRRLWGISARRIASAHRGMRIAFCAAFLECSGVPLLLGSTLLVDCH